MYVESTLRRSAVGRGSAARGGSQTGATFSLDQEAETAQAGSLAGGAPAEGLSALLSLQAVPDPSTGRRRAARRGNDLLDQLEDLRVALIEGRVEGGRLDRLVDSLRLIEPSGDAALDQIVADIDLRARVELAKLGRFPD